MTFLPERFILHPVEEFFMHCNITVLAENIDICRYFYREAVFASEPVLDSNFQVIFQINDDTTLTLESARGLKFEQVPTACRIELEVDDIESLKARMSKNGTPLTEAFSRSHSPFYHGYDPEGNLLCFYGRH